MAQLARRAGVRADTIRYYERLGLITGTDRTASGYRVFGPEQIDRIAFIRKAQTLGFSLEEIKQVLDLRGSGKVPCEAVIELAERRLGQTEKQLATLTSLRNKLRQYVDHWKRNKDEEACAATHFCNLIEEIPLDSASK